MLWTLIGILVLFWVLGLVLDIGGGIIHILLVIALIVFIWNMVTGRKNT
ncbi:lmo0937 family membrane protein [Alkalibacterium sp. f15]